jgi:hypothetical protein
MVTRFALGDGGTWYMNKISEIIERVKTWPAQRQEDVARVIERMEESGTEMYRLSDEERRLVDEGLASRVLPDDEMEKFWNRHQV